MDKATKRSLKITAILSGIYMLRLMPRFTGQLLFLTRLHMTHPKISSQLEYFFYPMYVRNLLLFIMDNFTLSFFLIRHFMIIVFILHLGLAVALFFILRFFVSRFETKRI